MANAGKVLALIGAILTILGTYLFSLLGVPASGLYVYGIGSMFNIDEVFQTAAAGGTSAWVWWVAGIVAILYLLSGFIQLLGVKSRIASFFGSLLPIILGVFIVIAVLTAITFFDQVGLVIVFGFISPEMVTNFVPISFEYGFMDLGLGTIIIILGGLLSLVSVFMSREN